MKTCGLSGPPCFYTYQFVYNFRFAVTSNTCTTKPREVNLSRLAGKIKKKKVGTKNHGHSLDFQKSQSKENTKKLFQSLRVLQQVCMH